MAQCVDKDVITLGICRGMQMLSVYSGFPLIQDIPTYFQDKGIDQEYAHRAAKPEKGPRPFTPHSVTITPGTHFYELVGAANIDRVPSGHHQAARSVEGTPLKVSGETTIQGVSIVEAVERTDKTCIVGFQFHPEDAVARHLEGKENPFFDYDTARKFFTYFVEKAQDNMITSRPQ